MAPPSLPGESEYPILAEVLNRLLGVTPAPENLKSWSERVAQGLSAQAFLAAISSHPRFADLRRVTSVFPPGHFHSPVVDPSTVRDYVATSRSMDASSIEGIHLPLAEMEIFWRRHQALIAATPFTREPDPRWRYHAAGGPFPLSDAVGLRLMIHAHKPRRIVEIGSGFSTACMLDSADVAGFSEFHITCVEPNAKRLRSLMRPGDEIRLTIHEREVQGMSLDIYKALEANDILFIDSTHVLKTGSDVHFELFHILPVLKSGNSRPFARLSVRHLNILDSGSSMITTPGTKSMRCGPF